MFKINFIILSLATVLLSACSKPSSAPSSVKEAIKDGVAELDSSPMTISITDSGVSVPSASLEVTALKRAWNVKPLVIRNDSLEEKTVAIVNALDANVETESDCPVDPLKLAPRTYCTFYIYFNRNYDKNAGFNQAVGTVSVNSSSIAISARIIGNADTVEAASDIRLSKTSVNMGSFNDEQSKKDAITVLNKSIAQLPLHYDDLTNIGNGFSGTTTCPASGSMLVSRKACIISFSQNGSEAGPGEYNVAVEVAGKDVTLQSSIAAAPVLTSNPQLTWLNPLSSPDFDMEDGLNESYIFNIENRTTESQSLFSQDFELGLADLWPDAFMSENNCNPVSSRKPCNLKLTFDPERFHFGVVFEKDTYIKDEVVTIKLTGNSPCNPDHPTPRPDAAYGKKLNANKTACVDNVGVFDDPDSVFGHAVFQ